MYEYLFYILLPIIAFLYASVGHGGASGYLALLSVFSVTIIDPHTSCIRGSDVKTVALTLNLFVSGIAFFQYFRAGYFNKKIFLPLAAASIPFAFLGGRLQLDNKIYFLLLAVFLLLAGLKLLLIKTEKKEKERTSFSIGLIILLGVCIGFASGMIGIGGGIILSPLLLFFNWANVKTTAGVSALFIFVNSLAGLAGQFSVDIHYPSGMPLIIFLVIVGGLLGSYLGAKRLPQTRVKQLLAIVLLLASLKIFFT